MVLVGFTGAGIQMVSHGVMTALFFAVVGMIYDRTHTRNMDDLSGMRKALPWTVVAFIIAGLVGMGMPGLSGFLAEFPIFLGVWEGRGLDLTAVFGLNPSNYYGIVAIIAILGIVITAATFCGPSIRSSSANTKGRNGMTCGRCWPSTSSRSSCSPSSWS